MRRYDQTCGLAHALDLVGDRWALLVVRELLLGPKRFGELHEGLPGAPTNSLATRLRQLEEDEIVGRLGEHYELTPRGRELEPTLLGLVRFGAKTLMRSRPKHPIRADSLGIAMLAFYDGSATTARFVLAMPTGRLKVSVQRGRLDVRHAALNDPSPRIDTTEAAVLSALVGQRSFPEPTAARVLAACRIVPK